MGLGSDYQKMSQQAATDPKVCAHKDYGNDRYGAQGLTMRDRKPAKPWEL